MLQKLFVHVCVMSAISLPAFAIASLNFTNDIQQNIYALRINDEGYEIKGTGLIVPSEIQIRAGESARFDIIHTPDENQPAFRQERDQVTEIRFDTKNDHQWHQYSCRLPAAFNSNLNKDLLIKASSCKKL